MATGHRSFRYFEPDGRRLRRRLASLAGDCLAADELDRLAEGDVGLAAALPPESRVAIAAMVEPAGAAALERIIGSSLDLLPVSYLDQARLAARAVGRVVNGAGQPIGTAVLVPHGLLLTNHHVIPSITIAWSHLVEFDYETDANGAERPRTTFRLDPGAFFVTFEANDLDATLVAVGERVSGPATLDELGHVAMSGAADKHAVGEFVTVIQHPSGSHKQIALRENRIIGRGRNGTTLHYGADTLAGSSGSPVFNDQLVMVALHHAGGPHNDLVLEDGSAVPAQSNEGIRVSAIVSRLEGAAGSLPDPAARLVAGAVAGQPPLAISTPPRPLESSPRVEIVVPVEVVVRLPGNGDGQGTTIEVRGDGAIEASVLESLAVRPPASPATSGTTALTTATTAATPRSQGLGPQIPLPRLGSRAKRSAAVPVSARAIDELALVYPGAAIVQDAERRVPRYVAVSVGPRLAAPGPDATPSTSMLPSRPRWETEPRVQPDHQLDPHEVTALLAHGIPIVPLVAEEVWQPDTDALRSIGSVPVLGRGVPGPPWRDLDGALFGHPDLRGDRITILTGPVLLPDDPVIGRLRLPRAWWKVLQRRSDATSVRTVGLVLDHRTGIVRQVPIAHIEDLTDLTIAPTGAIDPSDGTTRVVGHPADVRW